MSRRVMSFCGVLDNLPVLIPHDGVHGRSLQIKPIWRIPGSRIIFESSGSVVVRERPPRVVISVDFGMSTTCLLMGVISNMVRVATGCGGPVHLEERIWCRVIDNFPIRSNCLRARS